MKKLTTMMLSSAFALTLLFSSGTTAIAQEGQVYTHEEILNHYEDDLAELLGEPISKKVDKQNYLNYKYPWGNVQFTDYDGEYIATNVEVTKSDAPVLIYGITAGSSAKKAYARFSVSKYTVDLAANNGGGFTSAISTDNSDFTFEVKTGKNSDKTSSISASSNLFSAPGGEWFDGVYIAPGSG